MTTEKESLEKQLLLIQTNNLSKAFQKAQDEFALFNEDEAWAISHGLAKIMNAVNGKPKVN